MHAKKAKYHMYERYITHGRLLTRSLLLWGTLLLRGSLLRCRLLRLWCGSFLLGLGSSLGCLLPLGTEFVRSLRFE